MKVAIIGYSGSGKSTLAQYLGSSLNIPVLHLDKVSFLPNWQDRSLDDGLRIVREFMNNDSWIIDGNYHKFYYDRRMKESDRIVFMNFSRLECFCRAFRRYLLNRGKVRDSMAELCVEKFDLEFALWILKDGRAKNVKIKYFETVSRYKAKTVVVKNQKQLDQLMRDFTSI